MPHVPEFDHRGIIPPVSSNNPVDPLRSPYVISSTEFVERFATSGARRVILRGWLAHRQELYATGINSGFQWLDGSFAEDVEGLRGRPPQDLDVVTFFRLPPDKTQQDFVEMHGPTLEQARLKTTFHLDHYPVVLHDSPERLVQAAAYWYSVWAHQRDTFLWKGFLHVELDATGDGVALQLLEVQQEALG